MLWRCLLSWESSFIRQYNAFCIHKEKELEVARNVNIKATDRASRQSSLYYVPLSVHIKAEGESG